MTDPKALVQKLWNYCNVLRDDGLSYGDYVEQLTYLLFLKMADEQTRPPFNREPVVPCGLDWQSLLHRDGEELEAHYIKMLNDLGKHPGMLGVIFRKAQNRIQDPAKLRRLIVDLIDQERWMILDADVKGDAYEGLLQKNAEDTKSGAGQYFTPRPLIKAIVEVMRPAPGMTICDPACGTGGFLLAAHDHLVSSNPLLDPDEKQHLRYDALHGWEIVDNTARLCAMNLLLHGIGAADAESPIRVDDALKADPGDRFEMVLTNPPFGRKSSVTVVGADGEAKREDLTVVRDDFWASTSNKQLNFVQHVKTLLKIEGRAAIVVPDNVLFEGGAGETVRRKLLHECDVHTLLRLPTGVFYAQGVKANVLFFDRKPASETPWTKELWVYDLRTNQHFTLKENPLRDEHLADFIAVYRAEDRTTRVESERFRRFSYEELVGRDKASLDVFWLRDESLEDADNLPAPELIAAEIIEDLEAALAQFAEIALSLGHGGEGTE
ncbi:MAG: class I SAM-dependent DNA methyltransferase [Actinomycetota bacterium]|jgi:type I restriction enzyme M protein|nr:class I SAM-dependent DNA methyltransferase [Actinomycetota bacterium]MDA8263992.1 class I SAM-dependent DNA methyltransferase [Actinomycetota bacterium]